MTTSEKKNSGSMVTTGGLIAIVVVLLLGVYLLAPSLTRYFQPWSYESSIQRTSGTFYRVTSKYMIDGKEPMVFDVVVACSAVIRNYKDGDRSVDRHFTPNFVAKRTREGHALMLAVPGLCGRVGRLAERVGSHPFPVIIWFDDAKDLTLGTAYYSEDAYVNPNSRLEFNSIEFAEATRTDWDAWIEKKPENLVTREMVQSIAWHNERGKMGLKPISATFARQCHGVGRVKLPPGVREKIRKLWPTDRPRYWTLSTSEGHESMDYALHGERGRERGPLFGDYPLTQYWFGGFRGDGEMVPTREHGHALFHLANKYPGSKNRYYPAEYFPLHDLRGAPFWSERLKEKNELTIDINLDGGSNMGFLSCYRSKAAMIPLRIWDRTLYKFDGIGADTQGKITFETRYIFERDEYVYQLFQDGLGGMGDVL